MIAVVLDVRQQPGLERRGQHRPARTIEISSKATKLSGQIKLTRLLLRQ